MTDPRMTPANDAPVTVETAIADRLRTAFGGAVFIDEYRENGHAQQEVFDACEGLEELARDLAALASAPAGDGPAHIDHGASEALGEMVWTTAPAGDGVEEGQPINQYTYDELWQGIADATRIDGGIVAISVVKFREAMRAVDNRNAALARPRAAVGEREVWELPDLRDLHRDIERVRNHDLGNDRMRDLLRGAMDMLKAADVEYAALQSPSAKE